MEPVGEVMAGHPKLVAAVEKRVTVGIARIEKLTRAISARAFRDALVATEDELTRREDGDCEPAIALLGGIRPR